MLVLFFGVGVNGSNPLNRTKKSNSDATTTKFEDYIRNTHHPLHETGLAAQEGYSEDVQRDGTEVERILGETTEVDEYHVTSITKRVVQTKKVCFFLFCWLKFSLFGTLNTSLLTPFILEHFT